MLKGVISRRICLIFVFASLATSAALAQTTAFSYQGRLTEMGSPANGNYILQFRLFDTATGGTQIGATLVDVEVTATNGVFNTSLDFGAASFDGGSRFLEISVKKLPADPYTLLNPRQPILSAPYSIKSKTADNSNQLGGMDSSRFVQQDAGGNVAIGGNLTVSGAFSQTIVNAQTQFNLGGQRILSFANGTSNLLLGLNAGQSITTGFFNTFLGNEAGNQTTTGCCNTFAGAGTGVNNTIGTNNSFFGQSAGAFTTTGSENSFFGLGAGIANITGSSNSFFGATAGLRNTAGENSFFGAYSGENNTTGAQNSFFGFRAGNANATGCCNSFFGFRAGQATTGIDNSFFGNNAGSANQGGFQNSFFGSAAGLLNTSGVLNSFFGASAGRSNTDGIGNSFFGTSAGTSNTNGGGNAFFGLSAGQGNTTGSLNAFFGERAGFDFNTNTGITTGSRNTFLGHLAGKSIVTGSDNTFVGSNTTGAANLSFASALGAGASVSTSNTLVLGRNLDTVQIPGNLNIAGNLTGGNIVKNLNGLFGNITLAAGANITITPAGNTLTIASTGGGSGGILNQTTTQTGANFNIDGTGRANIFNAATQFQIGGSRVLTATNELTSANLFAGFNAGTSTTGNNNSFFGTRAGLSNTTGNYNTYLGLDAGGGEGGVGSNNTFVGVESGFANGEGNDNTFVGSFTQASIGNNLTNATAIGSKAQVLQSNSLVLGSIAGQNGAAASVSVGIGTSQPKAKLDVTGGNILVGSPGQGMILKSPDGATCRLLSIDNAGALALTAVACP